MACGLWRDVLPVCLCEWWPHVCVCTNMSTLAVQYLVLVHTCRRYILTHERSPTIEQQDRKLPMVMLSSSVSRYNTSVWML